MRRIGSLAPALACMLLGVFAAASAQAAEEGPFYSIRGTRLESGETREVTTTAKHPFVLLNKTSKVKVECKALKTKAGATIVGSSGANAGKGSGVLEFSECKGGGKEESLSGCEPEGGKITTGTEATTLGYLEAPNGSSKGQLGEWVEPPKGVPLAVIKFTGTCFTSSATVEGSLVGELGAHETETVKNAVKFSGADKPIWLESAGKLRTVKESLTAFGTAATLEGEAALELVTKEEWGALMSAVL